MTTTMTYPIRTVLWFNGRGPEAAALYCSLIPNSRIDSTFGSNEGGPDGDHHFQVIDFTLNGVPYQILDAGPYFKLTECVSIMVVTPDQVETDRLWAALIAEGGAEGRCGWLKDRFGLSWQIVPDGVMQLTMNPDPAISRPAMAAMMTMAKLDLDAILAATERTIQ